MGRFNAEIIDKTNPAKKKSVSLPGYLQSLLPSRCRLLGIAADGIVGKHWFQMKAGLILIL